MIAGNTALSPAIQAGRNGLDVEAALRVHEHNGFIVLGQKTYSDNGTEKWKQKSIAVADLKNVFPEMQSFLIEDGYMSINGFAQGGYHYGRKGFNVKYLNACWCDIDSHSKGHEPWVAQAAIKKAVFHKQIPHPSITIDSGRGAWAIWLIRGADGGPELVTPAVEFRRRLQRDVNLALGNRIDSTWGGGLGFDNGAVDSSRVMRFPGSINSKSQTNVVYNFHADGAMRGFTYTLNELAEFIGLPTERAIVRSPDPAPQLPGAAPRKTKRAGARLPQRQKRLNELEDLIDMRCINGLLPAGQRQKFAFVMAAFYRDTHYPIAPALDAVLHFARNKCSHTPAPFTDDEAMAQVRSAYEYKEGHLTNKKAAEILAITPAEIQAGGFRSLRPDYKGHPNSTKRRDNKAAALEFIENLGLPARGTPWTVRSLRAEIVEAGLKCELGSVHRWLKELGIETPEVRRKATPGTLAF